VSPGVQVPPAARPVGSFPERSRASSLAPGLAPLARSVLALAAFAALLHLAFSGRYGFFRDELYYAACGEHLSWGYMDHAPLAPLISRFSRLLLGDSLFALRFFPALASAALVWLTGWMAREAGGGRFAQFLAALAVLVAPIYLVFGSFLSMNAFEPLFWMGCAAIFLRIRNGGSPQLWLLFGLVGGIGILNKHSMLFFGSGVALGLVFTGARREFSKPWAWLGGALAFLLFLPNLVWEMRNGFPTIALLQTVMWKKYVPLPSWEFIAQQALLTLPLAAPIWLAGLWNLFRGNGGKYAALGWAYLVVLVEMILLHGKIYYLAPAYPMLLAAGAVWIESRISPGARAWLKPAVVAPLLIGGAIAAPLAMPILPIEAAAKYCRFWRVQAVRVENVPQDELPQFFGDMFGWPEQVEAVSRVYQTLPRHERARAAILAYNYGEAGAIDYFGSRYGLPKAISGHNQYALWGPRGYSGEIVVAIGYTEEKLRLYFDDVSDAAQVSPPHALPEESGLRIFICRKPKKSLPEMWPSLSWMG
jgi:hypothetical protein